MKKAISLGILASFFFAFTFILNRAMDLSGGYWLWSAPLRYLITLPLLAAVTLIRGRDRLRAVLDAIRADTSGWILWSTVGFGLFYLPLTLGSTFGPSWMTAACWELTIPAGILLTPLFGRRVPVRQLLASLVIAAGVFALQVPNMARGGSPLALIPILTAAFAYPLGNRMMMRRCPESVDSVGRVFGMTLCSAPFWLVCALAALMTGGVPSGGQVLQSFGVALFSGTIATLLFFHATSIVKDAPRALAAVEATQCGEVIFTLLGGMLILGDAAPAPVGWLGIALIAGGMIWAGLGA